MNKSDGQKYRLGIDYSMFDTTVNEYFLSIVFDELRRLFVNHHFVSKDFKAISDAFINSKILMPDGFVYQKRHGICSGSGFTNLVGSIVNYCLMDLACETLGVQIDQSNSSVLGDDGSYTFEGNLVPDLKSLSSIMASYGMVFNAEKIAEGKVYLSRKWDQHYGIATNENKFLKAALMPEKYRQHTVKSEINLIASIGLALGPKLGDQIDVLGSSY